MKTGYSSPKKLTMALQFTLNPSSILFELKRVFILNRLLHWDLAFTNEDVQGI